MAIIEEVAQLIGISRDSCIEKTRSSPFKPILKKRSYSKIILTANLPSFAGQAELDELQREVEDRELREAKRRNPLTPTHILRSQQRIGLTSRDLPESAITIGPNIVTTSRPDCFDRGNWTSNSSRGPTLSASKHVHFNDPIKQYIGVPVKMDDAVIDSESEDEELFMKSSKDNSNGREHSTIVKLPATTLTRPCNEPIREPPQVALNLGPRRRSHTKLSGFYYEEGGGFSSSVSPPESPTHPHSLDQDTLDDFSFDDVFALQSFSDNIHSDNSPSSTPNTLSTQSNDLGLEESQMGASVLTIPIPAAKVSLSQDCIGMMVEDDDEGVGIIGLASEAISTMKDLVGILWNAGWGGR
jgi:hypothetical protein